MRARIPTIEEIVINLHGFTNKDKIKAVLPAKPTDGGIFITVKVPENPVSTEPSKLTCGALIVRGAKYYDTTTKNPL